MKKSHCWALSAVFVLLTASCIDLLGEQHSDCVPYTVSDCPAESSGCFDDGCGGLLDCGGCEEPHCLTQCPSGACGTIDDNCGGTLSCGACGCEAKTCAATDECGSAIDDGCGGTISCGCQAPDSCVSGTCQCKPFTCADLGNPKGEAYDGCGHFIQCSGSGADTENIRILTGNLTTSDTMTLSDGTAVSFSETWDPGPGRRILQGLKPHIALIQEFKTLYYDKDHSGYWRNSDESLRDFVSQTFGDRWYSYREDRTGKNMGKPNGIVSYYPIKAAGQFESAQDNIRDRQHVWARIDIPGDRDLWVFSVHLTTGTNTDYGKESEQRLRDMKGLIANVKSLNIPAGDYLVIGGDFNISTRSEDCMDALKNSGLVHVDTENECPIDQKKNGDTSINRNYPYDLVLTSDNMRSFLTTPVIGTASGLNKRGTVVDTRNFTPLSAISPAQKADSTAKDMQHMAVLKDFALPRAPR